jgi:hypothetical protein
MTAINLDDLTLGQLKELTALAAATGVCASASKPTVAACAELPVIVRSYGAGVFFGYLTHKHENEVDLVRCRRIWNWKGANTLSEIALRGITPKGSRVAEPTPKHKVLDVIEIIEAQPEAVRVLESARWEP